MLTWKEAGYFLTFLIKKSILILLTDSSTNRLKFVRVDREGYVGFGRAMLDLQSCHFSEHLHNLEYIHSLAVSFEDIKYNVEL